MEKKERYYRAAIKLFKCASYLEGLDLFSLYNPAHEVYKKACEYEEKAKVIDVFSKQVREYETGMLNKAQRLVRAIENEANEDDIIRLANLIAQQAYHKKIRKEEALEKVFNKRYDKIDKNEMYENEMYENEMYENEW